MAHKPLPLFPSPLYEVKVTKDGAPSADVLIVNYCQHLGFKWFCDDAMGAGHHDVLDTFLHFPSLTLRCISQNQPDAKLTERA